MAETPIIEFPTMQSVHEALNLFANQNELTAAQVMDIFIAGSVQVQLETGKSFEPITVINGFAALATKGAPAVADPQPAGEGA